MTTSVAGVGERRSLLAVALLRWLADEPRREGQERDGQQEQVVDEEQGPVDARR